MKIYLCKQDANTGHDTYDGMVVCAEDETDARSTTTWECESNGWNTDTVWCNPEQIKVTLIGDAAPGVERGVVLASFKAG